ncbi:hypothetical protein QFC20_005009 [Naganishia adeliensis]|uniref:Uncharacterized protein n=1 Tax=Naganishia adeliensis TaxID=92952 RepID=A0ACC2VU53_9TREE|nr:hypothetical protein QFC20_005009 [Naganishia adeliensis]
MPTIPTPNAPVSYDQLVHLLKDDNKVKVAGIDVDGVLRGKFMSKAKFLSAAKSEFGFCSVIFGWDIHDKTYFKELTISNAANGFRDISAEIDLATYRRLPWENNVPLFLVSFRDPTTGEPLHACPRSLLQETVKSVEKFGGEKGMAMYGWCGVRGESLIRARLDWSSLTCSYVQYFQFKETAQSVADKKFSNLNALTPGSTFNAPLQSHQPANQPLLTAIVHGYSLLRPQLNKDYFHELYDAAEEFGIEIEGHHTETGPGVFETALAYTEAVRMADNALLFKYLAKCVGMKHGIMPTFMSKPWGELPGCSGHIHVSIRDKQGKNIFALSDEEIKAGGRADAKWKDTKYISKEAEYFLAGILDGIADVMPLLCPNINSYKRLVGGEAFWAPNLASYGYDSRAASIRILGPPDAPEYATRFEVRVPGADMHPMLAFAAIFRLGLRGIEKKLELPYGPIGAPGVTKEDIPKLPTSLEAATERFLAKDSISRELFGDRMVDHIGGTRAHEVNLWKQAVTNWEMERYMELA